MSITVSDGMTLYDLALMAYGDAGAVFRLLDDNPGILSLDDQPEPGTVIQVTSAPVNAQVTAYYQARATRINSGSPAASAAPAPDPCAFPFTFPFTFCN